MALRPVTVTQLNEYIARVIQTDPLLGNISVMGEISNLKYHSSGHVYFSLVDEGSKINCFLPDTVRRNLSLRLKDGMKVTIRGYINVFKKGGTYTLFVRTLEWEGEGDLASAFLFLKDKLEAEGLFDPVYKKKIPAFPKKIGVITSETGAAVQDILKIIKSRTKLVDIMVFPVQVQGDGAASDISSMIEYVNEHFPEIDTLIVGRGGGSLEDLWAFNEEAVARAIFRSHIPVISAVGHETDFTIADFVADKRAETPTAAAEMAVPDTVETEAWLQNRKKEMLQALEHKVQYYTLQAENQGHSLDLLFRAKIHSAKHALEQCRLALEENRPEAILKKGYALIQDEGGRVISTVDRFTEKGRYRITLQDGTICLTAAYVTAEKAEIEEDHYDI